MTLVAHGGRLDGVIADMSGDGVELEFRLEVAVQFNGRPALLRLVDLRLPIRSWRELSDLTVHYGPEDDEMSDGASTRSVGLGDLRVDHVHRPAVVDQLTFERLFDDPPRVLVHVLGGLYPPATEPRGTRPRPFEVTATVDVAPIEVPGPWTGPHAAAATAALYVDLEHYRQEFLEDGSLRLTPRG